MCGIAAATAIHRNRCPAPIHGLLLNKAAIRAMDAHCPCELQLEAAAAASHELPQGSYRAAAAAH